MSPPTTATLPTARPGGSTAPTRDELINAACLIRDNCGLVFGTRRIFRLVDTFKARAPRASGQVFFQYFCGEVQLTVEQQQRALHDPDVARVLAYADPTGEAAVNHVLRERRRG